MATLEKAIALAVEAHRGQVDKAGVAYILHPLRLMLASCSEEEQIVAVLHDTVEDTDVTFDTLREMGFSERVLAALECLTHLPEDAYEDYIQRLKSNPLARKIKLLDLEDNMNVRRLDRQPSRRDWERLKKYRQAWAVLHDLPEA